MVQVTENLLDRIKISENKSAATFETDTIFAQASDNNSCFYLNRVDLFLSYLKKVSARRSSNRKTNCTDFQTQPKHAKNFNSNYHVFTILRYISF